MEDDGATPSMPARMIIAEGGDVEAGKERWKSILQWREENHVVECFFCFTGLAAIYYTSRSLLRIYLIKTHIY